MLRRIASSDEAVLAVVTGPPSQLASVGLDDRTDALVRLAALVAMAAPATAYRSVVDAARHAGATDAEVIGTMIAVAPTVGLARLIPAAAGVSLALDYDVEAALERPDEFIESSPPTRGPTRPNGKRRP
jgi:alkylhydroperoxidase/carboxymuconolactone decarboxylase family protein YurZ